MSAGKPHRLNAPGDFYVEDGCCISCWMPFIEAPELFGEADASDGKHCYVKRQPNSEGERGKMIYVLKGAEIGCIRYRGEDRTLQSELVESGFGELCDGLPADLQQTADTKSAEVAARYEASLEKSRSSRTRETRARKPWWRFW